MQDLVIEINGKRLTQGQAITVHVALQDFAMQLNRKKNPMGNDNHAKVMKKNYLARIAEINHLYIE